MAKKVGRVSLQGLKMANNSKKAVKTAGLVGNQDNVVRSQTDQLVRHFLVLCVDFRQFFQTRRAQSKHLRVRSFFHSKTVQSSRYGVVQSLFSKKHDVDKMLTNKTYLNYEK